MYDKRLDTFVTIAELGSFSKAADILYLSVPALTKQISALEKEYGFTLFTRDARGAHLTKAGLSLYKDAKDLLAFSSSAISRASLAKEDSRIQLRIGNELFAPAYDLRRYLEAVDLSAKYDLQIYSFTDDFNAAVEENIGDLYGKVSGISFFHIRTEVGKDQTVFFFFRFEDLLVKPFFPAVVAVAAVIDEQRTICFPVQRE